jgi:hypothetical protein
MYREHKRKDKKDMGGAVGPAMSAVDSTLGGSFRGPPSAGRRLKLKRNKSAIKCKDGSCQCGGKCEKCLPDAWEVLEQRQPGQPYWSYKYAPQSYAMDMLLGDQTSVNEKDFSITYPFATSHVRDRVGDFLEVGGIKTEWHRRYPIACVDHAKWYPWAIGKCVSPDGEYTVRIDPERGIALCTVFLDKDGRHNEVPRQLFSMMEQKILGAGSIGYRPLKVERLPPDLEAGLPPRKECGGCGGLHLWEVELLEPTICASLPVNQDAVSRVLSAGIDGKALSSWLRPAFEAHAGPKRIWSNGSNLDRLVRKGKSMNEPSIPATSRDRPEHLHVAQHEQLHEMIPSGAKAMAEFHDGLHELHQAHKAFHAKMQAIHDTLDHEHDKRHIGKFLERHHPKMMESLHEHRKDAAEHFGEHHPEYEALDKDLDAAELHPILRNPRAEVAGGPEEKTLTTGGTKTIPGRNGKDLQDAMMSVTTRTPQAEVAGGPEEKSHHKCMKTVASWLREHGRAAAEHASNLEKFAGVQDAGSAPAYEGRTAAKSLEPDTMEQLLLQALGQVETQLDQTEKRYASATGRG